MALISALCDCKLKVRQALKKPEAERSEEEAAVLLLHRETVEELCKRQVRTTVLKRKQEEVTLTVIRTGLVEFLDVVETSFCFMVEVFLHSTNLRGVRCFIIKAVV